MSQEIVGKYVRILHEDFQFYCGRVLECLCVHVRGAFKKFLESGAGVCAAVRPLDLVER